MVICHFCKEAVRINGDGDACCLYGEPAERQGALCHRCEEVPQQPSVEESEFVEGVQECPVTASEASERGLCVALRCWREPAYRVWLASQGLYSQGRP